MRPLIAAVAVAVVPVPVPVVVEAVAIERALRRRTEPQVVVDFRQIPIVVGRLVAGRGQRQRVLLARLHRPVGIPADRRPRLVAQAARHVDLAQAAVVDELNRLPHGRTAAVHGPDLDDAVVVRGGLDHPPPFPHRVRRRLLDVDVLARLQRPDGRQRVPVVRRGDDDGVDVLVVHHAAQILHEPGPEGGHVLETLVVDPLRGQIGVDVAQRFDFDVGQPREAALERIALAADADARRDHAVVGAEDAAADVRRRLRAREQLAANGDAGGRRADTDREFAPRDAVRAAVLVSHGHSFCEGRTTLRAS